MVSGWGVMNEKLLSKKSVFVELLHGDCPPYQAQLQLFSHQDPFEASQDRQRQHEVGGILTENTFISSLEAISFPPPDCLEMTQSLSLVMFKLPPCSNFLQFCLRWRIKGWDQFGDCQSQVIALCQSEIVSLIMRTQQSNKGLIRDTTDKSLPNLVVKFLLSKSIKSQISFSESEICWVQGQSPSLMTILMMLLSQFLLCRCK